MTMATSATRQARLTPAFRRVATTLGGLSLALAIAAEILVPVGPLTVALALVATGCLALDRRLGPLPAAMIVVLAIPYDRAANVDLPRIAGIPFRPQDAAVLLAVTMALVSRRSVPRGWHIVAAPVALFLAVGLVALVVGAGFAGVAGFDPYPALHVDAGPAEALLSVAIVAVALAPFAGRRGIVR